MGIEIPIDYGYGCEHSVHAGLGSGTDDFFWYGDGYCSTLPVAIPNQYPSTCKKVLK